MVADGAVGFTLTGALAAGVAALSGEGRLTIAEFTPDGIVVWRVCRDAVGTPQCHHWPATPWSVLAPDGTLSSDAMRQLLPRPVGTLVVVLPRTPRGRDDTGPALGWLRAAFQGAQVHVSDTSLA